jgi:hypothetical protein
MAYSPAPAADAPDVSTVSAFKQTLLGDACFQNVAAGNYFATVLERLGIADAIEGKSRARQPERCHSANCSG